MTAKKEYKKELFSLPVNVVEELKAYAYKSGKKKSHIVAEAIDEYVENHKRKQSAEDFRGLIGIISANTPDIQEIKANRSDV
jgi:predicted DNA-binding protein